MMRKRFLYFALWLTVAGAMLAPQQTLGQTKIAVISDPHVISEELAENPTAWPDQGNYDYNIFKKY